MVATTAPLFVNKNKYSQEAWLPEGAVLAIGIKELRNTEFGRVRKKRT
jgi:hypothetical protein